MQAKAVANRDGTITLTLPIHEPTHLSSSGKTYLGGSAGKIDVDTPWGMMRVTGLAFQFPGARDAYLSRKGGKGGKGRPPVVQADLE